MNPIVQWVLRTMMKGQTGVMRTLPDKKLLDLNVNITVERLIKNGIDPSAIKTPDQVDNIIKQIEAPRNVQTGIKNTKSAKIMDMEGKQIDPRSKIMGGKQAETEAEILARIKSENKEAAQRFKEKQKEAMDDMKDIEDPEDMADGGRIGLKAGMTKRAFLKLMGMTGAGIAGLKSGLLGLGGKQATKEVAKEIITTPAAAGKPAWFDALVTRVVNEGEDVTKKFATKDREIVHATKVDDDAMVTVYRDLDDGTVRVDIDDATTNVMGEQGDSVVSLQVKGGQLEEGVKGKTPVEFEAVENDYRNYTTSPDGDYDTEVVENVVNNTKDLTADLTKVKMYAKGQKKPTIKEMMIQRDRAKRLDQAAKDPADYASDRGPDIDTKDYDYASGGIARMIGE